MGVAEEGGALVFVPCRVRGWFDLEEERRVDEVDVEDLWGLARWEEEVGDLERTEIAEGEDREIDRDFIGREAGEEGEEGGIWEALFFDFDDRRGAGERGELEVAPAAERRVTDGDAGIIYRLDPDERPACRITGGQKKRK